MVKKKTIPCRSCGKQFVPCAYCESHNDTFRWRNFACSIECAKKYIKDTLEYRNSQKPVENASTESEIRTTSRKKRNVKKENVEINIENKETE